MSKSRKSEVGDHRPAAGKQRRDREGAAQRPEGMAMWMRAGPFPAITLVVVLCLLGGCTAVPSAGGGVVNRSVEVQPPAAPSYQPFFEANDCWGEIPAGIVARCGYVVVPENRAMPLTRENRVRLAVMVLRAEGSEPVEAPTILLCGGPGDACIEPIRQAFLMGERYRHDGLGDARYEGELEDRANFVADMDILQASLHKRELIILDQRGTGYSEPSLDCRGEDDEECRARLVERGIDLDAYSTPENAADVNDVRLVLGYEQVNLIGGSYGSRLAFAVLRYYPESVRAASLEGVLPPQVDLVVEDVRGYGQVLEVLFAHCRADAACNAVYPDLEQTFYQLVERLNDEPAQVLVGGTGQTVWIDGDGFRSLVWESLYHYQSIRFLPLLIDCTARGKLDVLGSFLFFVTGGDAVDTTSEGMRNSVRCSDLVTTTDGEIVGAAASLSPAIREGVAHEHLADLAHCEEWNVRSVAPIEHTPVQSDVPALLLSGEFDPVTPPGLAEIASETLSRHYSYVFHGMGHTGSFAHPCWSSIISAFLDDPSRAPDTACMGEMKDPVFVLEP